MYAKKSLGQHFLTSTAARAHMIDAADVNGDDIVVEIGPGRGFLTESLLLFAGKVIALEKDMGMIPVLSEKFKKYIESDRLEILERDVLEFDPAVLSFYNHSYKVVANIPYYITGAIIKQFLSAAHQPTSMTLLVQKEVADRIIARDGKESILSVSVKAYGTPKYVSTVKAGSFNPAPKVDSAILHIGNISKNFFDGFSEDFFFGVMKSGFAHKRKMLRGNLADTFDPQKVEHAMQQAELIPTIRAEDVTREQWGTLAAQLQN